MANKAISELPQASNVNNQDLFVLEQSGIAKKLTAETFITEQGIIDALAEALDGHGGIQSVTLQSLSGRVRTYRITFTDGSATTFQVLDGNTIERIAKTSEAGLVSTYTIFMSDGTTSFFNVSNGADGDVSEATLNSELAKKAPVITETVSSTAIATFADGADDMPIQNLVADIDPVQDLNGQDAPYPAGSGKNLLKQTITSGTVVSSVTVTVNSNGSITLNGTASSNGNVYVCGNDGNFMSLSSGNAAMTLSGCPSGGSNSTYRLVGYAYKNGAYTNHMFADLGSGSTQTIDFDAIYFVINIYNGVSYNNLTFYPQFEFGSTATAYAPYENICPITGHTEVNVYRAGKNLCPTATITLGNGSPRTSDFYFAEPLPIGTYTFSASVTTNTTVSSQAGVQFINAIGTNMVSAAMPAGTTGTLTKTITVTDPIFRLYFYISTTDYNNGKTAVFENIQVEYGSSATAYEEYITPTTTTLSWQTEAGTVYGGTIDVATGVLTVDRAFVTFDGSEGEWAWSSGSSRPHILLTSPKAKGILQTNIYPYSSSANAVNQTCTSNAGSGLDIWIYDTTNAPDLASWKTFLGTNNLQVVYELANPQTYQLSEQDINTLLGNNTVWTDLGNVTVTYPADTKMFIENLTQPTEDDLVANQAITSGKYFMIGNSLYLALANIASGAQITIGTNAQRVSLADALNAINS